MTSQEGQGPGLKKEPVSALHPLSPRMGLVSIPSTVMTAHHLQRPGSGFRSSQMTGPMLLPTLGQQVLTGEDGSVPILPHQSWDVILFWIHEVHGDFLHEEDMGL